MQVNSMLKATTAGLALILVGSASQADTRTWDGEVSTSANLAANWSGDTLPTINDTAVVLVPASNRLPVLTANLSVGSLNVQQDAIITTGVYTLSIANSGGLDVDTDGTVIVSRLASSPYTGGTLKLDAAGNHQIDGLVDVRGSMWINADDAVAQGAGSVKLNLHDPTNGVYGLLEITDTYTFINKMLLQGKGRIQPRSGSAYFHLYADGSNNGIVDANVGSVFSFMSGMAISDEAVSTGVPLYRVQSAGSRLEFTQNATGLVGDVEILDCATIDVNEFDFATTGDFDFHGTVEMTTGGSFAAGIDGFSSTTTSGDCD